MIVGKPDTPYRLLLASALLRVVVVVVGVVFVGGVSLRQKVQLLEYNTVFFGSP